MIEGVPFSMAGAPSAFHEPPMDVDMLPSAVSPFLSLFSELILMCKSQHNTQDQLESVGFLTASRAVQAAYQVAELDSFACSVISLSLTHTLSLIYSLDADFRI